MNKNINYEKGYEYYHKREYEKAYEYFKKASEEGYELSYISLAKMYHRGRGIKQDLEKAIEYYQLASKKEIGEGYYFLGEFYEKGIEVKEDKIKALRNYEKAAELKYIKGMIKYAELALKINDKDEKIKKYLLEAIEKGSNKAIKIYQDNQFLF